MQITVLSFNIHKGVGWHPWRSTFSKVDEQIALLAPDIVFFQEILGAQAEYLVLDKWPHYSYGRNVIYAKGHYGNAILSKFPIIFYENFNLSTSKYDRRGLLHSVVKLPNSQGLHLLCAHLGLFKKNRAIQYEKIVDYIESLIRVNEPIILGGDFNDWGSHATLPLINGLGLHEAFLEMYGTYAKTFPAWGPVLKLDRIYTRGMQVLDAACMRDKNWRKLSDHLALKVNLEI